jgi:phenylalanine ammonia-lyase
MTVTLFTTPCADSLNWGKAPLELMGTHLEEVKRMVAEHRQPLVKIEGVSLTIALVADTMELDEFTCERINTNNDWVMSTMANGIDNYSVTIEFDATSHR